MATVNRDVIRFAEIRRGAFASVLSRPSGTAGYRLADDLTLGPMVGGERRSLNQRGPWIIEAAPPGKPRPMHRYPPLAKPGLPDLFANLRSDHAILRFANRYGLLDEPLPLFGERTPKGLKLAAVGESLEFWRHHIRRIRLLRRLWCLVEKDSARELSEYVWWEKELGAAHRVVIAVASADGEPDRKATTRIRFGGHNTGEPVVDGGLLPLGILRYDDPALLARWRPKDPIAPMRYLLGEIINRALAGRVTARVLPFGEGGLVFQVDRLVDVLYALFALDLSGAAPEPGEKRCVWSGCPNSFRPKGNRRYCAEHQEAAKLARGNRWWRANREEVNRGRRKAADAQPALQPPV